jgi:hypothetical protein
MSESSASPVFRLIYRSHDLIPAADRKAELGRLFTGARSNNKGRDITGALLLHGDYFVQTLEGDETAVRGLFEHIQHDSRHDSVQVLETGTVAARTFARWSMARVSEAEDETDINLISHRDGIADAASRGGMTDDQEVVLGLMRDAARGAPATS